MTPQTGRYLLCGSWAVVVLGAVLRFPKSGEPLSGAYVILIPGGAAMVLISAVLLLLPLLELETRRGRLGMALGNVAVGVGAIGIGMDEVTGNDAWRLAVVFTMLAAVVALVRVAWKVREDIGPAAAGGFLLFLCGCVAGALWGVGVIGG